MADRLTGDRGQETDYRVFTARAVAITFGMLIRTPYILTIPSCVLEEAESTEQSRVEHSPCGRSQSYQKRSLTIRKQGLSIGPRREKIGSCIAIA